MNTKSLKIIDATHSLPFKLTKATLAACGDPSCVVARAVSATVNSLSGLMCDNTFEAIVIGLSVTKIFVTGGTCIRYATPHMLRSALKGFDNTGKWNLPEGEYALLPLPSALRTGYPRPRPPVCGPRRTRCYLRIRRRPYGA